MCDIGATILAFGAGFGFSNMPLILNVFFCFGTIGSDSGLSASERHSEELAAPIFRGTASDRLFSEEFRFGMEFISGAFRFDIKLISEVFRFGMDCSTGISTFSSLSTTFSFFDGILSDFAAIFSDSISFSDLNTSRVSGFSSSCSSCLGVLFLFFTGSNPSGTFFSFSVYTRFISIVRRLDFSFTSGCTPSNDFRTVFINMPNGYSRRNGGVRSSTRSIIELIHFRAPLTWDSSLASVNRSIMGKNTSSHFVNFCCSSSSMVCFDFLPTRPLTYSRPCASAFSLAFFSRYSAALARRSMAFSFSVMTVFGFFLNFFSGESSALRLFDAPASESSSLA
mmetsp:Transcript_23502/g.49225  ORF Transcript_23502/g.49225 Transcript_23502/m.49225 type:complete len:338 (+) Transcript_23502:811-1824(+)